ncbi:phage tail assembly chaperone [Hyphobacterium marinum]|uniref:Phage tail assembly chaperone n=1 Tax=Hyphobacterium marinum TaxID=3116574 RepID=A0ABU7M0I1_9PROT|nr:phage tail assembly chaperone [Hyphobacterium sp. Y6023]MEE2567326.1 phage tail assembly chaperone [Hyphobacterium sp. Y6023]
MTAIPFDDWLCLALRLGLMPAAFWRLSLKEWRALTAIGGAAVLDRTALEALRARFPD